MSERTTRVRADDGAAAGHAGGLLVVGAGPGVGTAVARRFGSAGFSIGLLARTQTTIDHARDALAAAGVHRVVAARADVADEVGLRAALDTLVDRLGLPAALVYNAAVVRGDRLDELSQAERQARYAVNVLGALTTATHLAPRMIETGGGTIIVTGGMPEPDPRLVSLSVDKAALRVAVALLARQYGNAGIHVATVTIAGPVAPGTRFDPDRIAEQYWRLHTQSPGEWEREVVYGTRTEA